MKDEICLTIAMVLCLVGPVLAGPNAGGTLLVHDTGIAWSTDPPSVISNPPADCPSVDNNVPLDLLPDMTGWVWKVYAAFPTGSSPRLKALSLAEAFTVPGVGVFTGGLPDAAADFEIPNNGWPAVNGGNVGISFGVTKTALINEVYWFAGYADSANCTFAVTEHPNPLNRFFVDDSEPPREDAIFAYSSVGFGVPGQTICPQPPPTGACCYLDGHCVSSIQSDCSTGDWRLDVPCSPNPCPQPPLIGACCFPDGQCVTSIEADCSTGDWRESVPCSPNPCPQPPFGACCFPDGHCEYLQEMNCAGVWFNEGSVCDPNPCPQPPEGACCYPDGQCVTTIEANCSTGDWRLNVPCSPNPCPQPPFGACCFPDGHCEYLQEMNCAGVWFNVGSVCDPNPCPQPPPTGACCYPSGACDFTDEANCPTGDWRLDVPCDPNPCPQPPTGSCCYPSGACDFTDEANCPTGDWRLDVPCDPNPCPQPPYGACCYPSGQCDFTYLANCPTGDWRIGVPCDPNPCPQPTYGACCYPDGHCVFTYQAACPSGNWLEDVPCDPNPCPQPPPTGACCIGTSCIITTESNCTGEWQGLGTDCTPNPCCRRSVTRPSAGPPDGTATTSAGPGRGVNAPHPRTDPCPHSTLYMNHDGSTENAFTWQLQGVAAPDYGAFAEGYSGVPGLVCGMQLLLTRWGSMTGNGTIDLFVWDFDADCGNPGAVLSVTQDYEVSGVAFWPTVTTFDIDITDAYTDGFFVGYWPQSFVGVQAQFGCAMDEDGIGGLPRTNIAPGIGLPTGWQNPSVVGYFLQAFGLGPWVLPGGGTPTVKTTWSRIKMLYH